MLVLAVVVAFGLARYVVPHVAAVLVRLARDRVWWAVAVALLHNLLVLVAYLVIVPTDLAPPPTAAESVERTVVGAVLIVLLALSIGVFVPAEMPAGAAFDIDGMATAAPRFRRAGARWPVARALAWTAVPFWFLWVVVLILLVDLTLRNI